MKKTDLTRRDFHRLSMAALGGVVAGTAVGCSQPDPPAEPAGGGAETGTTPSGGSETAVAANPMLEEPHVCRGLNTCEGKGAGGDNACAGQGTCATAKAHDCHYQNECKGQGGCGETYGQNACKEKGECAVPLSQGTWEKARAKFEELMKTANKEFGSAPEA